MCENESARISVMRADLPLTPDTLNNTEGMRARGNKMIVGVRNDTESNSMRKNQSIKCREYGRM